MKIKPKDSSDSKCKCKSYCDKEPKAEYNFDVRRFYIGWNYSNLLRMKEKKDWTA